MTKTDIYAHFHPDERRFVDKAADWVERAGRSHELIRSDFLDPRQAFIVASLVRRNGDLGLRLDGGYPRAERQRALIAPEYRELERESADIGVVAVHSQDRQIGSLDHGDYMGAILHLGIKRDKIGDIHVFDWGCHCLAALDMAGYIGAQLRQVHRVQVATELLSLDELRIAEVELREMHLTVASLRLDGIAGDVYRMSRAKVLEPIKAGRCKVNWKAVENPSKMLEEGDIVSLKGFGRFKIVAVEGETKSGRVRVTVGKYV